MRIEKHIYQSAYFLKLIIIYILNHFESDYHDSGPIISYDGGYYVIKRIEQENKNAFLMVIEHEQTISKNGKLASAVITGKLLIHFC
jgi:hypothetical protein